MGLVRYIDIYFYDVIIVEVTMTRQKFKKLLIRKLTKTVVFIDIFRNLRIFTKLA